VFPTGNYCTGYCLPGYTARVACGGSRFAGSWIRHPCRHVRGSTITADTFVNPTKRAPIAERDDDRDSVSPAITGNTLRKRERNGSLQIARPDPFLRRLERPIPVETLDNRPEFVLVGRRQLPRVLGDVRHCADNVVDDRHVGYLRRA